MRACVFEKRVNVNVSLSVCLSVLQGGAGSGDERMSGCNIFFGKHLSEKHLSGEHLSRGAFVREAFVPRINDQ